VAEGTWYTEAVRWAASAGIISGSKIPAETTPWPMGFRPDDAVTREQLAAMLYRYAQYKKANVSASASLSSYGDAASVSSWAASAMQWAVGSGIINGIDGNLVPVGNATRAQVATMLMRYSTSAAK
ncbi:MAG: S-layer homology domain-containing protein, partial [Bacteroidales bacterium]|nr:S-layer homology domain-containing protein [Bacteroidales bacterium]